jgi:aquaporin Z
MTPPTAGWHWREWSAEFAGTAALLFAVLTAKVAAVEAGPPFSRLSGRIIVVGIVAGAAVVAIAVSPLGRRSGAHLNPAVTIGFAAQGITSRADLIGYIVAQTAGAVLGICIACVWGPVVASRPVRWALIAPATAISQPTAATIEVVATAIQLAAIFAALRNPRTARHAAWIAGTLLTIGVISLATTSGAGFNPERALGPDVFADAYPALWVYLVGPPVGGFLAAILVTAGRQPPLTGKLRHDPSIPCHLRCALPHAAVSPPALESRTLVETQ